VDECKLEVSLRKKAISRFASPERPERPVQDAQDKGGHSVDSDGPSDQQGWVP